MMTKQCPFCGKEFETDYETKIFCNVSCRANNSIVNKYGPKKMLQRAFDKINSSTPIPQDEIRVAESMIILLGLEDQVDYELEDNRLVMVSK